MPANLPAGRELDERVCRSLGIEPFVTCKYNHRGPCGDSVQLEDGVADCREFHWPAVSTDGNAMLRLIAEMRERGWFIDVSDLTSGTCYAVEFIHLEQGHCSRMEGEALPHAVALAALAALGGTDVE